MTEDVGLKLLAAVEALMAEVHTLNTRMADERDARKTLADQRAKKAARQKRWASEKKSDARKTPRSGVSMASIPQVVRDLDQDQVLTTCAVDASKTPEVQKDAGAPPTRLVWAAYRTAYRERYSVEPVRNRKINGQLSQFVSMIPIADAPAVAQFFVSHNQGYYVAKGHAVGCLLADAEKLHMEWRRGRVITATESRQIDKTQANLDGWAQSIEEQKHALVK